MRSSADCITTIAESSFRYTQGGAKQRDGCIERWVTFPAILTIHFARRRDSGVETECHMDWADYLRDEAAKYRQLAEAADDPSIKQELLDLAVVCEEAADNIEDRMPGG
jgi:hypothetical protein